MRVVFMGTPDFSGEILKALAGCHQVVGVFTKPDSVRGRGTELSGSPVKLIAEELGLRVFQPQSLRSEESLAQLAELAPEVICVAAYSKLLPPEVLNLPVYGCLNVHASLLPRWRGAAPIERAILAGDDTAGVCIMKMEEGLDTGDYCIRASLPVAGLTARELTGELARLGAKALVEALDGLKSQTLIWTKQPAEGCCYANKIEKGELNLSPHESSVSALRKIRCSGDAHPSRLMVGEKSVTVCEAQPTDIFCPAGILRFVEKKLILGLTSGALELTQLKPEGKRQMTGKEYAAGVKDIKAGISWEVCRA